MRYQRGEIVWMVMLILMIGALSASRSAILQAHTQRLVQWEDQRLQTQHELDKALLSYARSPRSFPAGIVPFNEELMNAPLSSWQSHPQAMHLMDDEGIEVHLIMELTSSSVMYYRLNGIAYHPGGTVIKKQCLFACDRGICRQLSTHAV